MTTQLEPPPDDAYDYAPPVDDQDHHGYGALPSDLDSNREAELAVLGACFLSQVSRKRVRGVLTGGDFHWPEHELLWNSMETLERTGHAIGVATLVEMVKSNRAAVQVLPELAGSYVTPEEVDSYAAVVRSLSIRRRTTNELVRALQATRDPRVHAEGFLAQLVTRFTQLRDHGAIEQVTALMLRELLAMEDEPYDWLIPGLLERGDRFMLTGEEGMGKSVLLRQIALCAAAGLHPFGGGRIAPMKALIIDAENSERQVRRSMRPLAEAVSRYGQRDPRDFVMVECTGRMDITSDMALSRIHQTIDAQVPDVITIGPLYRLTPRAIQTDDEAAPVLAALDTIKDRGIAILIEAHAGHGKGATGARDMRPRGSSALLGWPEFGYGLRADRDNEGHYVMERWRGDRDERDWPTGLERHSRLPWSITEQEAINQAMRADERAMHARREAAALEEAARRQQQEGTS